MSQIKVEYINHMGDALTVTNAARVSYGGIKATLEEKDKKLIRCLANNKHMSPFEHCSLTVKITCPLYIRSQIHRHRTFAYNEISRRYTSKDLEFYGPENYRIQSKDNKQASDGNINTVKNNIFRTRVNHSHQSALELYNEMLDAGVCREQARGVLPQDLMTEFYMTGNLRNWAHFLELRDKSDAQFEVQLVAQQTKAILLDKFEYAAEVLLKE